MMFAHMPHVIPDTEYQELHEIILKSEGFN